MLTLVAASAVASLAGVAFSPYLLVEHPLLLVGLAPEGRHLVLAAGRVDLWMLLLVATLRRVVSLMASYGLGMVWGQSMLRWVERRSPRLLRLVQWLERLYLRFGAPTLVVLPIHTLTALAGIARTRWWAVALGVLVGQAALVGGTLLFGESISDWTAPILGFLSDHVVESTAVCVALVVLHQLWSRRRSGASEPSVTAPG